MPSPIIYNGKKDKLLPSIRPFYPSSINNYYEPFCGGASVFFDLFEHNLVQGNYYLSDINSRIIRIYSSIELSLEFLKYSLRLLCPEVLPKHLSIASCYNGNNPQVFSHPTFLELKLVLERYFYLFRSIEDNYASSKSVLARIGSLNPDLIPFEFSSFPSRLAAKDLFLNRMSMNGWRESLSGNFNLPFYDQRAITPTYYYQPDVLDACSLIFNHPSVSISCSHYLSIEQNLQPGDFLYLDPPYLPSSKSANFTNYSSSFSLSDHLQLSEFLTRIHNRGVKFLLSNSSAASYLYPDFKVHLLNSKQYSNAKSSSRKEILVSNY